VRLFALAAALACATGRLLAQHDMAGMSGMEMRAPPGIPTSRFGSGTSWRPDSSRTRSVSAMRGNWMLSLQGAAHGFYDDQYTKRGAWEVGITDWEMLMAMRELRGGLLQFSVMTSIEPFVLGGSGYPELLQNGGTYRHSPIFDRQHPHDALMELAATYAHPAGRGLGLSLYAGAVGEPALGPVAYMHRPSAENDPLAPIGHHWQDAAHQSFGVVTFGVNTHAVKLEGSVFNAREADENNLIVDYQDARLDSYAGRVSWAATPRVVASAWWGYLNAHERLDPTTRMHRYGASVITEARGPGGGRWSSTLIWGMNLHHHGIGHDHGDSTASRHHSSHSVLAESNLEIGGATAVFGRLERVQKDGEELGFEGGDLTTLYDIRSVAVGATRHIVSVGSADFSLGARGSVNFIPATLLATYGTRTPAGLAVFAQVRPVRASVPRM
jgi:hypothetical protein